MIWYKIRNYTLSDIQNKSSYYHCPCKLYLKVVSAIFFKFTKRKYSKNDEKCFLFHVKSSFRSQDIYVFMLTSSPHFSPVSHCWKSRLKIMFKIHDVMNGQTRISKYILIDISECSWGLMMKLGHMIEYYQRNVFIEKLCSKCKWQPRPRPLYKMD